MLNDDALATAYQLLATGLSTSTHAEDPTLPETVQAMQMALHIPKDVLPRRTDVLDAAARSVVKLCFDPRVVTDPDFRFALERWYGHRIRKVARRARNSAWQRVQNLTGVTVHDGSAQVRAFLPSAVSAVPADIKKLQISGTELPLDVPNPIVDDEPIIYIDAGLTMTLGKAAAQVGHASMLLAANKPLEWVQQWATMDFAVHVREIPSSKFQQKAALPEAVVVHDAGFTEVAPNSITTVALA